MRLIDTHLHLWDPERFDYDWLRGDPDFGRRFALDELAEASRPTPDDRREYVFVQAECAPHQGIDEARWVASLAESAPIIGIVAYAPVENGDLLPAALDELRGIPQVVGVRRLLQSEPVGFGQSPGFVAGARRVAAAGLTFDACVVEHQLPDVAALARAVPELLIMLDHLGKPRIGAPDGTGRGDPAWWRDALDETAAQPNVWVKLSGLPAQSTPDWTPELFTPYLDAALDAFGPHRIVFGSDWPASSIQSTYERWIAFVEGWLGGLDAETADGIRWRNAERFYRLSPQSPSPSSL